MTAFARQRTIGSVSSAGRHLMVSTKARSSATPRTRAAFSCGVCFRDIMFSRESIFAPIGTSKKLSKDKASAVTPAYILMNHSEERGRSIG